MSLFPENSVLTLSIVYQVLPDVKDELEEAIKECRVAFSHAITVIDEVMEQNPDTNVAIFAHLTRRMSAFDAIFGWANHCICT